MDNIVEIDQNDEIISVMFYIEEDEVMEIGEKLHEIDENAYMNGYNWEAVLNAYMEINAPDILDVIDSDPEAGMYAAYFENTEEGVAAAHQLADIINTLVSDPKKLYSFVQEHSEDIEWD